MESRKIVLMNLFICRAVMETQTYEHGGGGEGDGVMNGERSMETYTMPKGNQSWIFIGRTGAEAETPILWPPGAKNWPNWKDPDAGKDWRQEERGQQRVRWLNGITDSTDMSLSWWWSGRPGVLQSMGGKESDTNEQLNWTALKGSI